jgi:hypothetical protein
MAERSDKERTTLNLTPIKARIEQLRPDSAWKALSLSKKVLLLLEEYLDSLEQSSSPSVVNNAEATENLEQMGEFVKLLMGLRPRNGLSFAEIAGITGLPSRQVEELYQLVEICRKQHEPRK